MSDRRTCKMCLLYQRKSSVTRSTLTNKLQTLSRAKICCAHGRPVCCMVNLAVNFEPVWWIDCIRARISSCFFAFTISSRRCRTLASFLWMSTVNSHKRSDSSCHKFTTLSLSLCRSCACRHRPYCLCLMLLSARSCRHPQESLADLQLFRVPRPVPHRSAPLLHVAASTS